MTNPCFSHKRGVRTLAKLVGGRALSPLHHPCSPRIAQWCKQYLLRAVSVKRGTSLDLYNLFRRTFSFVISYVVSNEDCWENKIYISQAEIIAVLPDLGERCYTWSRAKLAQEVIAACFLVISILLDAHPSPSLNTEHFQVSCVLTI